MSYMFSNCYEFNSDLSKWDVGNVTRMNSMFNDCESLDFDPSKWNIKKVNNMSFMFYGCKNFSIDYLNWDVNPSQYTRGILDNSSIKGIKQTFVDYEIS